MNRILKSAMSVDAQPLAASSQDTTEDGISISKGYLRMLGNYLMA